jgi:tripartite ATP-independent transporter DctM subunit
MMEAWLLTLLMFGLMLVGLAIGIPIAFALSGTAIIFTMALWGPQGLIAVPSFIFSEGSSWVLLAVPLFVLMANLLEVSGLAEEMYDAMYRWFGGMPGGLASGTVVICAIFAAMAGTSGVATVTMGLIALPSMLKYGYDKKLAVGTIAAGGALGILIPPSVPAVIYASITGVSVGGLFAGGMVPGLLLSAIFIIYITVRSIIQPKLAPRIEVKFSWGERLLALKNVISPLVLVIIVLGGIYTGVCTPTEAAGLGAFGSMVVCAMHRKLTWGNVQKAAWRTLNLTTMVIWIVFGAACFVSIYTVSGASEVIIKAAMSLPVPPLVVIFIMQFVWFILGMIMDPAGMCMITVPVFLPIVEALGFDPLWFGVLFIVNSEMAYLTPPFGFNLFYMRAVSPPEITTLDIYRSMTPFIGLQALLLVIIIFVPDVVLWLPSKLIVAPGG